MALTDLTVKDFIDFLASGDPTPGGGSAAALAGCLGAALCHMVARLTLTREKYKDSWEDISQTEQAAENLLPRLLEMVERDTRAYNQVVEAMKLPRASQEEKATRKKSTQEALKQSALAPLETLKAMGEMVTLLQTALQKGNPNGLTDIGVAVQLMRAAALGAAYNVRINLGSLDDQEFVNRLQKQTHEALSQVLGAANDLGNQVEAKLAVSI